MYTPTLYIVWGLARPVSRRPYAQRCDRPLPPLPFLPVCWLILFWPVASFSVPSRSSALPPSIYCLDRFFRSAVIPPLFPSSALASIFCSAALRWHSSSSRRLSSFSCPPPWLLLFRPILPCRPDLLPLVASRRDRGSTLRCTFFASLVPSAGFCLPAGRGRFLLRPCAAACRRSGADLLCFEPSSPLTLLCSATAPFLFSAGCVPISLPSRPAAAFLL